MSFETPKQLLGPYSVDLAWYLRNPLAQLSSVSLEIMSSARIYASEPKTSECYSTSTVFGAGIHPKLTRLNLA